MIFKNFLVVIFTLSLSFSLLSQNQIELEWNNVKYNGVEVISFDKSVYLNQYNGLPSFQKNTQIFEEFYYDINIVNITYIPVTESEKLKLNHPIDIHFKINTGMNRLGFNPKEAKDILKSMKKTHYSTLCLAFLLLFQILLFITTTTATTYLY